MGLISSARYLAEVQRRVELTQALMSNMEEFAKLVHEKILPVRSTFALHENGLEVKAIYEDYGYICIVDFDMFKYSMVNATELAEFEIENIKRKFANYL